MIRIDIPMPKNCGGCPICNEYLMCGVPCNGRGWGENDVSEYFTHGRPKWCPLLEEIPIKPIYKDAGIFCGNCNSYIKTCDTYCSSCGNKIEWSMNRRTGE